MAPWMYRQAPWNDLQSHVNEAASKNNQLSMVVFTLEPK